MLTDAQLQMLATHIKANTEPNVVAALAIRNDTELARLYNLLSELIVWRKTVSTFEVGNAVNYVAVEAMTDINRTKVTTFYAMNPTSFDPSRSDIRTYWSNTFGGALGGQGQSTRDALEALWRRAATVFESVFATGTGNQANPASLVVEGQIGVNELSTALNRY